VAPPGSVLVGESTQRAAAGAIVFEEAGEQLLKGKASPVPAWRAVQVVGRRGGAGRSGMLEPPFVGREDELRLVKDLFHATTRERKPRLVSVIGQAGIGKSRLAWEFEKYIDGVTETAYWHIGRSPAYGEGISFWALAEMIRERAGIAETDDPETATARLSATLDQWVTDPAERRWVEPRLAGLLGLEELPAGEREELFAAWRTFFERIAEQNTVILVFEELQWADQGLLDFIEHLLTWSRAHPIFVLALTRPELLERRPAWGSGVRNAASIVLEPLPAETMQQLLLGLVPGLPQQAVRAIVDRSEGIPLYAVETVRMLLDRGQLRSAKNGYTVEGTIDRLAVPETLRALIAARLDAIGAEERATLADAAILGQSFTMPGLAGVSGLAADELQPRLDRLVGHELLRRDDDPRSPERGQYQFVQALVREVAVESLARADRRAKHLAAARFYETLGEDELAGVLASHYLEAYRATPAGPEAEALEAQARIALRAAADRAAALHSHAGALKYLEDALPITHEPAEEAALHERAGAAAAAAILPGAFRHVRRAVALYGDVGDTDGVLRATTLLAHLMVNDGHGREALEVLEPAVVGAIEASPEAGAALAELARAQWLEGRIEESIVTADRALSAAAPRRQTGVIAAALVNRAGALSSLGRIDEPEAMLRGAIAIADRDGHVFTSLRARNNLLATTGEDLPYSDYVPLIKEALDRARRFGHGFWVEGFLVNGMVDAGLWSGDWASVDAALAEISDLRRSKYGSGFGPATRGALAAFRGDDRAATADWETAEPYFSTIDTTPQVASAGALRAVTALGRGDWEHALSDAMSSASLNYNSATFEVAAVSAGAAGSPSLTELDRLSSANSPSRMSACVGSHLEALVALSAGNWSSARSGYQAARRGYAELENRFLRSLVGLEFEAYLGSRFEDARTAGREAEEFFTSVGAGSFPARYRNAFRGTPAPPTLETPTAAPLAAVAVDVEQPA
ncbi:MAG TPA: AAA family ATPase, partial [Candidatus Limnocylindria bacterium]